MKTFKTLVNAVALASLVSMPAFAGGFTPQPGSSMVDDAFSLKEGSAGQVDFLSEQEMSDTKGELAFLVAAIVGIDLALIGAFWGVYVPSYGTGGCLKCSNKNISSY